MSTLWFPHSIGKWIRSIHPALKLYFLKPNLEWRLRFFKKIHVGLIVGLVNFIAWKVKALTEFLLKMVRKIFLLMYIDLQNYNMPKTAMHNQKKIAYFLEYFLIFSCLFTRGIKNFQNTCFCNHFNTVFIGWNRKINLTFGLLHKLYNSLVTTILL